MNATVLSDESQLRECLFRMSAWHHTVGMDIEILTEHSALNAYDTWLMREATGGTLWQSVAWQSFQRGIGRETAVYCAKERGQIVASALITIDRTVLGYSHWDCPRGPVSKRGYEHARSALLSQIISDATASKAVAVTYSPLQPVEYPASHVSLRHEQPQASVIIDLAKADDVLLADMHPKCRYNIKKKKKKGVQVHESDDINAFYRLLAMTATRDGFRIHSKAFYQCFLDTLPQSVLLLALHEGRVIAGLIGVAWNQQFTYCYGASDYAYRALMAPFLLQWKAMQRARELGDTQYDLLGIDPPDGPPSAWAGVTSFKRKFGGSIQLFPPEREVTLRPIVQRVLTCKRSLLG